ncbi:MAG: hypothetical protein M9899_03070 [Bdellovibrionaceae bacterium]|nr:hypothetical protein [Pseudobdellovibrionaceae bacterium]
MLSLRVLLVTIFVPQLAFAFSSAFASQFCDENPNNDYITPRTVNEKNLKEICDLEREQEAIIKKYSQQIAAIKKNLIHKVYINAYDVDSAQSKSVMEKVIFSILPNAQVETNAQYTEFVVETSQDKAYELLMAVRNQREISQSNLAVSTEIVGAGFKKKQFSITNSN